MSKRFWEGRRVFMTGHTGFKGSWLALWLQRLGAEVVGYALPAEGPRNLFQLARLAEGMTSLEGDIRSYSSLEGALAKARPQVVFHLAAQPLVRAGFEAPRETFATNVQGTVNLLEAVRRTPTVRAVVNVTTDKVYRNQGVPLGYRELDPLGGEDPYSASKACAELVTDAYRASFLASSVQPVAVATARAGNVLGGGDWGKDRLIPDLLAARDAGLPLALRYPSAMRPWQHVLEPVRGYLMLAERLCEGGVSWAEAWNFGPDLGEAWTVSALIERFCKELAYSGGTVRQAGEHPPEAAMLKLDNTKARTRLGWMPRLSTAQGLALTAAWIQHWERGADPRVITLEQIASYETCGSAASHA